MQSVKRVACRRAASLVLLALAACSPEGGARRSRSLRFPPTPADHAEGERLFDTHCSSCHGAKAAGTEKGPPLVHDYYKPSHHADAAFTFAVERGVAQHHWHFGNMPPQPQVDREALARIIGYVRWLQRAAGIE